MKQLFSYVFFFLLALDIVNAQVGFQKTFGGDTADIGRSVQQTVDGGYIITGMTASYGAGGNDVYLIKTDAIGDTIWTKTYGNSGWDLGECVEQTSDGGFIVAGFTNSFGWVHVYLIKTNPAGDTLWSKIYTSGLSYVDYGKSVKQTADAGYIVAGYTMFVPNSPSELYLIKTDAIGDTLWTRIFSISVASGPWYIISMQQTTDGGYIVSGGAGSSFLLKINTNGDILWMKYFSGSSGSLGNSMVQTSDGGYIIAESTVSFGAGGSDIYLIKADSIGNLLWSKTYGGTGDDYGESIQQTYDGGYIILGTTNSFGLGGNDVYLIRTDSNGDTLWTKTYGGSGEDYGYSIQQTIDSGYVIVGKTNSFGAGDYDIYLIKTDANGYNGTCNQYPTNTIVTSPSPTVSSDTIVTWSGTIVLNPTTIVNNTATVVNDLSFYVGITDIANVLCYGDSTGSATVTPFCGATPYTYLWNDTSSQTDSIATGLPAGTYQVIINDASGLMDTAIVTITQPTILSVNITDSTNVLCNDDSTGSATATPAGGTPPYTYLWNDPDAQTNATAIDLPVGIYTVILTDSNGCTATDSVTINEPQVLVLTTDTLPDTTGAGVGMAWVTVFGGTPPYSYQWSDPALQTTNTAFNLSAGTYTVVVTDSNGCIDSSSVTIGNITGIKNLQGFQNLEGLRIFPNPNTGEFTLEIKLQKNTTLSIRLYQIDGQLILNQNLSGLSYYRQQLNLSKYTKGIYYVQIVTDEGVLTKKVVYQ